MLERIRQSIAVGSLAVLVCACSGGSAATTPAAPTFTGPSSNATIEDALDSAPVVTGGRAVFQSLAIHPDAATNPRFLMSWVGAGQAQGGVPCIDCVKGAQTGDNIGVTGPGNYVPTGATWQYTIAFTNMAFRGTCTLTWAITAGAKTVDKFATVLRIKQAGGFVLYGLNRSRPAFSGNATLTGRATCGSEAQTATAALIFQ